VLIIANEEIDGDAAQVLVGEIRRSSGNSVPDVRLVCPVLASWG